MQPPFRKILVVQLLALFGLTVAFEAVIDRLPDRRELGARSATIEVKAIVLPRRAGPLRLAGAWELTSKDPRFGGISALAIDGGQLLALTDSGVLIAFPKPGGGRIAAIIRELPSGPGDPRFKRSRDSEALARDSTRRGWWVSFENRHGLWLFDPAFRRALRRIELGQDRWPRNSGAEGLAMVGRSMLAFAERGDAVLRLTGGSMRRVPIIGAPGRISDAASLPDGRLAVIGRDAGPLGFRASLGMLERTGESYRYAGLARLPLSPLDNAEALAAERLPGGGTRLWVMTDDNYHPPLRTLLVAYDLPPQRPAS